MVKGNLGLLAGCRGTRLHLLNLTPCSHVLHRNFVLLPDLALNILSVFHCDDPLATMDAFGPSQVACLEFD